MSDSQSLLPQSRVFKVHAKLFFLTRPCTCKHSPASSPRPIVFLRLGLHELPHACVSPCHRIFLFAQQFQPTAMPLNPLGSLYKSTYYMHRCCPAEALLQEKLIRQAEAIRLLEQLLESEKEAHLQQMRSVTTSLESFVAEKQAQEAQNQQNTLRLTRKLDQYKQKLCHLSGKIKQQTDSIKALMERKLALETDLLKVKETLDWERQKRAEDTGYVSELKQALALRELESKELKRQNQRLSQEVSYLQSEIASFAQVKQKFINIDTVTEQQYQKEIAILKDSLKQQLTSTTHQIFNSVGLRDKEHITESIKTIYRVEEVSIEEEELRKLSNFIDYGITYFELPNQDIKQPEAKRIFQFISSLVADIRQQQAQIIQMKAENADLNLLIQQKLGQYDHQIRLVTQKQMHSKQIQTGDSGRLQQLQSNLNSARLKNYELVKIISFLSRFANYAITCSRLQATKTSYFHCAETALFKPLRHKRKTLRSFGLAVLFMKMLGKGSRRARKIAGQDRFQLQHLNKYVHDPYLARLIHSFSRKQSRKVEVRNHKIEQLAQIKAEVNPHQRIIQILNQQSLNQGQLLNNYSSVFTRFIFETQQRLA